jgi:hypothetical protein
VFIRVYPWFVLLKRVIGPLDVCPRQTTAIVSTA